MCVIVGLLAGCAGLPRPARINGSGLDAQADRLILVTVANPTEAAPFGAGATPHDYAASWPWTQGRRARALGTALARDYHLRMLREWPIATLAVDCFVYAPPPDADRAALLARMADDARVRLAEPMQLFTIRAASSTAGPDTGIDQPGPAAPAPSAATPHPAPGSTYNDPYFSLQHGFQQIGADLAQRRSRGDGVRVALIDTGVDLEHPDMARVGRARDFFDEDAAAFRRDRHGTAVAGIIAAIVNNRIGIAGIAPGVRLQVYKACQPLRPGLLAARCNSFTLALALQAAIDDHAQIVNLSLGGPSDRLLGSLLRAGERRGMVFVGAVPEDGRIDGFPLDVPGVIAADDPGGTAGAAALHAPGRDVLSLAPAGRYDFVSGSSFAAAQVTAAVALLQARAPRHPSLTVRSALAQSQLHGGLINICVALARLMGPGSATSGCVTAALARRAATPLRSPRLTAGQP